MVNRKILHYLYQLIIDKTWEKAVETDYHENSYYGLDKSTQTTYLPKEDECKIILKLGHPNAYLNGEPRTSIYFAITNDDKMRQHIRNYEDNNLIDLNDLLKEKSIKECMIYLDKVYLPDLENKFENIDYKYIYKNIFEILSDEYKNCQSEKDKFDIMKDIKTFKKMYDKDLYEIDTISL